MKHFNAKNQGGFFPLWVLVLILAILWVLWYLSGGPQRAATQGDKPFLDPLAPAGDQTYGPGQ